MTHQDLLHCLYMYVANIVDVNDSFIANYMYVVKCSLHGES